MNYWLMKTEPSTFGIDDLARAPGSRTTWDGVRNYQARNMLRDGMKKGDLAFLYHSSCPVPGIAGIVEVVREGYPDPSAWDPGSDHFDPKSTRQAPTWYMVDVQLRQRMDPFVPLSRLRDHAEGALAGMLLLRRGNRLSITPVEEKHWRFILSLK